MLYTSGLAVGQMSGKLGGIVASRNRSGSYFRNRAMGTNPNSPRQNAVRNIFANIANRWGNVLTEDQHEEWITYANAIGWKNRLGEDIILTGYNMFLRSNAVAARAGFVAIDDGPSILTLADTDPLFEISASEATQLVSIIFDTDQDWVDEDEAGMQILMSRPVGPGVNFITPTMRLLDTLIGDSGTPLTSPQTADAPFPIAEDQKILCSARILRADGRLSNHFHSTASVAS